MGGKASRDKGKRGEQEVIRLLRPVVEEVYTAHSREVPLLQRNTLQSHKGGTDIVGLEWLALEVKYAESKSIPGWWRQACGQARQDQTPVLFYRSNNERWTIVLYGLLALPSGVTIRTPVRVGEMQFMSWFRARLQEELMKA